MSRNEISVMEIYVYMHIYIYYTVYVIYDNQFIDMLFYHFMTVLCFIFVKTLEYTYIHQQIGITFLPKLDSWV